MDGKAEHELKKTDRYRENGKCCQYLVRWLGYDESKDYWMKAEKLTNDFLGL